MTTNSEPRKFRIRKSSPLAGAAPLGVPDGTPEAPAPAPPPEPTASASADRTAPDRTAPAGSTDPAEIRREGLTARQLRMARRLAQKQGVAAASDLDAVRQLRLQGIDPFARAKMLELVVPETEPPAAGPALQLPQTVPPDGSPAPRPDRPSAPGGADQSDQTDQIGQIRGIQRDIARRRRRKLALLALRLALFVGAPTALAGYYYHQVATPMYATKTEFVIQQADGAGQSPLGGLFSGTGFATSQDSITVQSYLTSRDAMLRLDQDAGFKSHYSQEFIDPIQRLPENASNEAAYDLYRDNVRIGYDPTEGIIKMEVIAADPETSAKYSRMLIDYAEARVDALTQRLREDQMAGARESFEAAESKMLAAQERVLDLQEKLGVLDPAAESGSVMSQITAFETELRQKRLELDQLVSNARPAAARVAGVRGDIARLRALVAELRGEMTEGTGEVASLARVSAELRVAETDLQTRTALMQQALQALETARIEANRQVRYLSLGVSPIPPDEATYPRAFENTLLAFLVFAGLYLLLSLTASILREQVSA